MSCGSASRSAGSRVRAAVAAAFAFAFALVGAAERAAAQAPSTWELGLQGVGTLSDPEQATAGLHAGFRGGGRFRLAAFAGAGVQDDRLSGRGELVGHFLLSPYRRRGPGLYGGGGIAGVVGPVDRAYAVLVVGVESAPYGRSGWAIEAGVGGGARLAVGWRWRWRARRVAAP
jgi:hypothetical protein